MTPEPVKAPAEKSAKHEAPKREESRRGERTALTGKVTSAKMEKTIVVEVQRLVQHPKYRRVVRISTMKSARPSRVTPSASCPRGRSPA